MILTSHTGNTSIVTWSLTLVDAAPVACPVHRTVWAPATDEPVRALVVPAAGALTVSAGGVVGAAGVSSTEIT